MKPQENKKLIRYHGLTDLEIKVLESARDTGYEDLFYSDALWCSVIAQTAKISMKTFRGVVSSLIQKNLVKVWDFEGNGKPADQVMSYTDLGKSLFEQPIVRS